MSSQFNTLSHNPCSIAGDSLHFLARRGCMKSRQTVKIINLIAAAFRRFE